jgi:DNA-binding CsgD family transcriptional regulator/tetratricopeptide (TPR) repeat protein
VLLLFTKPSSAKNIDSLLKRLDFVIQSKHKYVLSKEHKLDSLKTLLQSGTSLERRDEIYRFLFQEYEHYNLDGALRAAKERRNIAIESNNPIRLNEANMWVALILGKMGMYKETFNVLASINRMEWSENNFSLFYHVYHSTYLLLYESAFSEEERFSYRNSLFAYKDSLLSILDTTSAAYQVVFAGKNIDDGNPDKALKLMLKMEDSIEDPLRKGSIGYSISLAYEAMGDIEMQKWHLAKAAIFDIENAKKSYIALRKLAVILYQQGDLERAYDYIQCALEDAYFAKARFRLIEISEALPIISEAYNQKVEDEGKKMKRFLIAISLLAFVLLGSIIVIYRQLRRIALAEAFVKRKNEELLRINIQFKELNEKLSEAAHVKEVYVGYVFNICSTYLKKLEDLRLDVHKKLRAHQVDEALKLTGSSNFVNRELKEFFQNFDAVFLGIYPHFIEEFNAMLKNEAKISPRGEDILTPELRVFALIRLGVSDSSKIAQLLHYSPQTVYNYKLKIKSKLVISKDEFYKRIQRIG